MPPHHPKFLFSIFVDAARNPFWPEAVSVQQGDGELSLQAKSDRESWLTLVRNDALIDELDNSASAQVRQTMDHIKSYAVWGRGEASLFELASQCPRPEAVLVSLPDGNVVVLTQLSREQ